MADVWLVHDVSTRVRNHHVGLACFRFYELARPNISPKLAGGEQPDRVRSLFARWLESFRASVASMTPQPFIVSPKANQKSGVYCIRNTVSGRCYVGSAVCIQQRWYTHRSQLVRGKHHSRTLIRSWLKHGAEAFEFEVLEFVPSVENLIEREQFWIDKLNSACPQTGFNMAPRAGSPLGVKHSAESRARMSAYRMGRKKSESGAAAIRSVLLSRNVSHDMREKVRASKLKLYASTEMRERLREQALKEWRDRRDSGGQMGWAHTEETKMKISLSKTGKMTDAHKAAIAASNKSRVIDRQVFVPLLHR